MNTPLFRKRGVLVSARQAALGAFLGLIHLFRTTILRKSLREGKAAILVKCDRIGSLRNDCLLDLRHDRKPQARTPCPGSGKVAIQMIVLSR